MNIEQESKKSCQLWTYRLFFPNREIQIAAWNKISIYLWMPLMRQCSISFRGERNQTLSFPNHLGILLLTDTIKIKSTKPRRAGSQGKNRWFAKTSIIRWTCHFSAPFWYHQRSCREENLTLFLLKNKSPFKTTRNLEFHEDYLESSKIVLALSNLDFNVSNLGLALWLQCLSPAAGPYYFRTFFYAEAAYKFYAWFMKQNTLFTVQCCSADMRGQSVMHLGGA